jgi:exopolysaccharide biosynthesis WecB/TagA/CpsF family protein
MDIYNIFTSRIPADVDYFDPRKKKLITFLNPHSYTLAFKNPKLFESFDVIAPDGILLVLALNCIKAAAFKIKRFSCDMTSIVPFVFKVALENKLSMFFLGADAQSINESVMVFKSNYPELNIAGYQNGYFPTVEERQELIYSLVLSNPDIIFIGMGTILQETMAIDLRVAGYTGAIYTCGGFLHQTRKEINFYPQFIDKLNLRFFYRLVKEEGFFKRTIRTYPEFCLLIIRKFFSLK